MLMTDHRELCLVSCCEHELAGVWTLTLDPGELLAVNGLAGPHGDVT